MRRAPSNRNGVRFFEESARSVSCACRKSDSCVTMMQPTDYGAMTLPNSSIERLTGASFRRAKCVRDSL